MPKRKMALGWFLIVLGAILLPHLIVLQLALGGYFIYRGLALLGKSPITVVKL